MENDDAPRPRRVPVQRRSRERVCRILAAAAELIVEVGYERTTMNEIADRARTSVGSVYQFFPGKDALFQALSDDHVARTRAFANDYIAAVDLTRPWRDLAEDFIDSFYEFFAADPSARAVWLGSRVSPELIAADDAMNSQLAEQIAAVLLATGARGTASELLWTARVGIDVTSALFYLAFRSPSDQAAPILAQTKTLIHRYLAPLLDPDAGRRGICVDT